MSQALSNTVEKILSEKYFAGFGKIDRPFSVFGYRSHGKEYGGGWDGIYAENICGYSHVYLENIYITRIQKHFSCAHNVANDSQIQLAIRAIHGLNISQLSEDEKEHAAKAIECGYLYREDNRLYTKILVCDAKDRDRLFNLSDVLSQGVFQPGAEAVAEEMAAFIRHAVPNYLLSEWRLANILADMPVLDSLVEVLIEKGVLIPPEDGLGAEGCWMSVRQ